MNAWLYPINDRLEVRSHLFVLLKNQSQTLRMRLGLSAAYFPTQFKIADAASPRWKVTARIARGIADLADDAGASTMFVLIPTAYQVDQEVFVEYRKGFGIDPAEIDLEQPNRLLSMAMATLELVTLDALVPLRQAHNEAEPLYGRIDSHFSPRGHQVVADYVIHVFSQYIDRPPETVGDQSAVQRLPPSLQ